MLVDTDRFDMRHDRFVPRVAESIPHDPGMALCYVTSKKSLVFPSGKSKPCTCRGGLSYGSAPSRTVFSGEV